MDFSKLAREDCELAMERPLLDAARESEEDGTCAEHSSPYASLRQIARQFAWMGPVAVPGAYIALFDGVSPTVIHTSPVLIAEIMIEADARRPATKMQGRCADDVKFEFKSIFAARADRHSIVIADRTVSGACFAVQWSDQLAQNPRPLAICHVFTPCTC